MSVSYSVRYGETFPWSERDPKDNGSARCTWCRKSFKIDTMGRGAFLSHQKSARHRAEETIRQTNLPLTFTQQSEGNNKGLSSSNGSSLPGKSSTSVMSHTSHSGTEAQQSLPTTSQGPSDVSSATTSTGTSKVLKQYMLDGHVTSAEVLWAMQAVASHTSFRKTAETVPLFSLMFPDSDIAKKIKMDRTKVGYLITYGLAPYFSRRVFDVLEESSDLVLGFDESLNKIAQEQQLDIYARYWSKESDRVESTYVTSIFLTSTRAQDLIEGLKSGLQGRSSLLFKIEQLSMDGPNVNWKVMKDLSEELATLKDLPTFSVLNIGSCGLHVVHGAFQGGMKRTGWRISEFLEDLYYLFKDFPLRRADFTAVTGSDFFPLKFCNVRWVENATVARRAEKILPHLRKYVEAVKKQEMEGGGLKESHPSYRRSFVAVYKSRRFQSVMELLKDPMLGPKLAFFVSIADTVESFLREFQSDAPMAPFLFSELTGLMQNFFNRVLKPESFKDNKKVADIDLSEKNLLPATSIDVGFATTTAIKTARNTMKITDKVIILFRNDCRLFYQCFLIKMNERSPLKYRLTRFISCLDPEVIHSQVDVAKKRLQFCLEELVLKGHMSGVVADKVKEEYGKLCALPSFMTAAGQYRRKDERLDAFWLDKLTNSRKEVENLCSFVKKILILSHGNATLERGFSVNSECLIVNQTKESLIAQRLVYDAINKAGGVDKVNVTKSLIHSARNAHSLYTETLQKKKEQRSAKEKEKERKRQAENLVKELESKKVKLLMEAQKEAELIQEQIKDLKK